MAPIKEQLEALAWKHCTTRNRLLSAVTFTLDQLDAYFNERLKMVAGEPVAYQDKERESRLIAPKYCGTPAKDDDGWTPLYALLEL